MKYKPEEAEERWVRYWLENKIYKFDPKSEKEVFSIDTPPPTVSGAMHLGHAFSFSQQDIIARYKRMKGFNVFQPFGTDDNGLATERLIEKKKKVKATRMDREEFINLCLKTLDEELRPSYIEDWKRIGMSCDWDIFYTTISPDSRKISQKAFLDLVKKERVYRKNAPVMWDPVLQTALSQVELEDKEIQSKFNDIMFKTEDGEEVTVSTTRPELLSACVAVFVHPEDEKNKYLEGKKMIVPFYHHKVSVMADQRVDPEKGSGVVMCCTFGDQNDIEWYKAYDLPLKEAIAKDGRMTSLAGKFEGMKVKEAREKIIEEMKETGELTHQEDITHVVNVGERSGAEIEFIHSKQWFIRYLDLKDDFLKRGEELNWYPAHMKHRYDNWVKGLQWDWCISRQRFSGVPFPVWYDKETGEPVYPKEEQLPVDPMKDVPEGYSSDQLLPEKDVMDTWATSSLTPHLAADRFKGQPVYDKIFPMSLRPQAHDIISFWLFNTVVRSHLHDGSLPFYDVMISGWALDPKGKKMSKSKGNVIKPQDVIQKYGADAVRYWAAESSIGEDIPYKEKDLVTGKKTVTKILNASKFAIMHLKDYEGYDGELCFMDRWILSKLNRVIKTATESFDKYEYSKAKHAIDNFFWNVFCDHYLEIVKDRLYNPGRRGEESRKSAQKTLYTVVDSVIKLFAPIMPFITEEVYHMHFAEKEGRMSVHLSDWPEHYDELIDDELEEEGDYFTKVLSEVRKYKSENNLSLKEELPKLRVNREIKAKDDFRAASKVKEIEEEPSEEFKAEIV
ncbi:MAG: valine--tRNA ligase [Nanobdellota archaeon]